MSTSRLWSLSWPRPPIIAIRTPAWLWHCCARYARKLRMVGSGIYFCMYLDQTQNQTQTQTKTQKCQTQTQTQTQKCQTQTQTQTQKCQTQTQTQKCHTQTQTQTECQT
jgi:hypothetical protein